MKNPEFRNNSENFHTCIGMKTDQMTVSAVLSKKNSYLFVFSYLYVFQISRA